VNIIFISGSMRIKNLNSQVIERINNIINLQHEVIVGDAEGVDSSIQAYLRTKNFKNVTVYCTGKQPRNNIGMWPVKKIETDKKPGTRVFFTAKDITMAEDCDYGLMIWDSKSTGTLSNAIELLNRKKSSVVYINKVKKFINIKDVEDLEKLISFMSESAFLKADAKLKINKKIAEFKNLQGQLF
jgi:hypothetical protein